MLRIDGSAPTNSNHRKAKSKSEGDDSKVKNQKAPMPTSGSRAPQEAFGVSLQVVESPNPEHRHTTHPPGPCLGRTLLILKVSKVLAGLWG